MVLSASASGVGLRSRRHTPFLPDDHWKGPPEFGPTETDVRVMVNGTADLVLGLHTHIYSTGVVKVLADMAEKIYLRT